MILGDPGLVKRWIIPNAYSNWLEFDFLGIIDGEVEQKAELLLAATGYNAGTL